MIQERTNETEAFLKAFNDVLQSVRDDQKRLDRAEIQKLEAKLEDAKKLQDFNAGFASEYKICELQQRLADAKKRIQGLEYDNQELAVNLEGVRKNRDARSAECQRLRAANTDANRLQDRNEELEKRLTGSRMMRNYAQRRVQELEAENANIRKDRDALRERLNAKKEELTCVWVAVDELREQVAKLQKNVTEQHNAGYKLGRLDALNEIAIVTQDKRNAS